MQWLKISIILLAHVSVGQHFGLAHRAVLQLVLLGSPVWLQSSDGLMGVGGGSLNLMAYLCSTGCHLRLGFFTWQT